MSLRAVLSIAGALVFTSGGPGARAQDDSARPLPAQWIEDDEGYSRPLSPPPPALPQQLNGVIRVQRGPEAPGGPRLERIRDVFLAMRRCWQLPRSENGPSGQQLTVRISFKRDGQVLGEPRITFYQAGGDRETQERFRRSVLQALQRCTPLPLSESLGSAIAGRPFTFRFVDDRAL